MNDYFLKAESEDALREALAAIGMEMEDGLQNGLNLSVIGPITKNTGTEDEPVIVLIPGFHANLRGELTAEQIAKLPVIATPTNPVRVWA